jgi:exonuclease SbcC
LAEAAQQLEKVAPLWKQSELSRERWVTLEADRRVLLEQIEAQSRDLARLQRELDAAREAREASVPLQREAAALPELRGKLQSLDALAAAESERRVIAERVRALRDDEGRLDERLAKLQSAPQLEVEQRAALDALRSSLASAGHAHDEARTTWARDRQEAETRLDALRLQQEELTTQKHALEGLGEESPCPTCSRPLGASYRDVLALVTEQLDTVTVDASYFRQRVRELASVPESVTELDTRRSAIQQDIAAAERRYARIQAAVLEREQLTPQLQSLRDRIVETTAKLATYSAEYDSDSHARVRADVVRLQEISARASQLQVLADREPALRDQLDQTDVAQRAAQLRLRSMDEERALLQFDATRHEQLRSEHAEATRRVHEAQLHLSECRGNVQRAEQQRDSAHAARQSLEQLLIRAAALENERSLHDELDDEYAALREELNDQLRPELSELASAFLESLTDGRYASLELDENYAVQVLEDGLPKTVLSGGEEDLCNLVLRLAISQMIAERAGQPFSLLILDEVFGSLDESRRENVLALLRRLHDRFEQVMVITHIEDVREGLDRVLSVTYDQESGSSRVQASLGGAAGAEAAAWEIEGAELRERAAIGEATA